MELAIIMILILVACAVGALLIYVVLRLLLLAASAIFAPAHPAWGRILNSPVTRATLWTLASIGPILAAWILSVMTINSYM